MLKRLKQQNKPFICRAIFDFFLILLYFAFYNMTDYIKVYRGPGWDRLQESSQELANKPGFDQKSMKRSIQDVLEHGEMPP